MIHIVEKVPRKIPGTTSLFVSFDYNKEIVDKIKECTPANYDSKKQVWEIPTTRLAKFINTVNTLDDIQLDLLKDSTIKQDVEFELSSYKTKPYEYQLEGIQYGLNHDCFLLLDAPGLGKTLQITYLAQELKKREHIEHCLIICGINTLKSNWEKEIQKHSDLSCTILGKKINSRGKVSFGSVQDRLQQLKKPIKEFFVITNVETLRDDKILKELKSGKNKFDMIVVDEVHTCKSPTSQQGRNLLKLTTAKHRIGLTGTLLLNNPLDVYVPLKWIRKDNSTYSNFRYQYVRYGGYFGNEVLGYKNIDVLKDQINDCSLRRTKDLLDLPEKNIIDEYLDMNESQSIFYSNLVNGIVDDIDKVSINTSTILSMVTRLRQASACPSILTSDNIPSVKMDRCCELVDEIVSSGNKVVVFSMFKETLNLLNDKLKCYNPLLCTGDIKDEIISQNIDVFQNQEENRVILCTCQKMGTGITLTAASYAIFIDTPWTDGILEQCEDRIHRIGSSKPVFIYHLWCNNTFDLRVKDIVEGKGALSGYVIDDNMDSRTIEILKRYIQELK